MPNFSRRRDCFQCRRPRSPRAGGGAASGDGASGLTRGPVGAGGLRPLLGGRGSVGNGGGGAARPADRAPSFRVPGASVAARSTATLGSNSWVDTARRAVQGGAATPPVGEGEAGVTTTGIDKGDCTIDEDGFQTVTRRAARRTAQGTSVGGANGNDPTAAGTRDGDVGGDAAADDARGGQGSGEQPTVAELQHAWQEEVAVVRRLRQQGIQSGHPAMQAACAARDAAEKTWRESKDPAPTSVRLGRAQAKLERAISLQADARRAMLDAERAHREHMASLQAAMDECAERVRVRKRQLKDVQEEIAADGTGSTRSAQQEAMQRVHSTICGEVGPTIAALVEQLDSSTPAWTTLNELLGKLSTSRDILESAGGGRAGAAQAFDIADDNNRWEGWSEWSESHELDGPSEGHDRAGQQGGRWEHDQELDDGGQDEAMDTDDWWGGPPRRWQASTRWQARGHGQWSRSSWADQLEEEHGAMGGGGGTNQRLCAGGLSQRAMASTHRARSSRRSSSSNNRPRSSRRPMRILRCASGGTGSVSATSLRWPSMQASTRSRPMGRSCTSSTPINWMRGWRSIFLRPSCARAAERGASRVSSHCRVCGAAAGLARYCVALLLVALGAPCASGIGLRDAHTYYSPPGAGVPLGEFPVTAVMAHSVARGASGPDAPPPFLAFGVGSRSTRPRPLCGVHRHHSSYNIAQFVQETGRRLLRTGVFGTVKVNANACDPVDQCPGWADVDDVSVPVGGTILGCWIVTREVCGPIAWYRVWLFDDHGGVRSRIFTGYRLCGYVYRRGGGDHQCIDSAVDIKVGRYTGGDEDDEEQREGAEGRRGNGSGCVDWGRGSGMDVSLHMTIQGTHASTPPRSHADGHLHVVTHGLPSPSHDHAHANLVPVLVVVSGCVHTSWAVLPAGAGRRAWGGGRGV